MKITVEISFIFYNKQTLINWIKNMDRATKIYSSILGIICLSLAIMFFYEPVKVKELNNKLESIVEINTFPYQFKVVRINDSEATLSSPVSTDLPCGKVIGVIFPTIKNKSLLSPEFQKAKDLLARVQTLAENTVKSDPKIKTVIWELDRNWLIQNGISLNTY